jgi:hypothetical protein
MPITSTADWGITLWKNHNSKGWGKKVTVSDINLSGKNGCALNGSWVRWGEKVSLVEGEYLVITVRTNGSDSYKLVKGYKNCVQLVKEWKINKIIWFESNEVQKVKAQNNRLYAYGLYIVRKAQETNRKAQLLEELNHLITRVNEVDKELLVLHTQEQNDLLQARQRKEKLDTPLDTNKAYNPDFEACSREFKTQQSSKKDEKDENFQAKRLKEQYKGLNYRQRTTFRWLRYDPSNVVGYRWVPDLPQSHSDLQDEVIKLAHEKNILELNTTLQDLFKNTKY